METPWQDLTPLVEKKDNYQPDTQQILQYAEHLGLQMPEDQKYLPLVREGLTSSLPPFWEPCETPTGELVFRNRKTRQVVEDNPLDQIYRLKIQEIKRISKMYGVEPINEESALRESSTILRTSRPKKSQLRISNLPKSDHDPVSSLIERHITQQSQEFGSDGETARKPKNVVPQWKKKHQQRVQLMKTNIRNFFPDRSQLITSWQQSNNGTISPLIDQSKLSEFLKLQEDLAMKKQRLYILRRERQQLQSFLR